MAQKPRRSPAVYSTVPSPSGSSASSHAPPGVKSSSSTHSGHAQEPSYPSSASGSGMNWSGQSSSLSSSTASNPARQRRSPAVLAEHRSPHGVQPPSNAAQAASHSPAAVPRAAPPRLPAVSTLQSMVSRSGRAQASQQATAAPVRPPPSRAADSSGAHTPTSVAGRASHELLAVASSAFRSGDMQAVARMGTETYASTVSRAASGAAAAQRLVGMQTAMLGAAAAGDVASLIVVLRNAGSPPPAPGKLPNEALLLSAQHHAAIVMRLILHEHAFRFGSATDKTLYRVEGAPTPSGSPPSGEVVLAAPAHAPEASSSRPVQSAQPARPVAAPRNIKAPEDRWQPATGADSTAQSSQPQGSPASARSSPSASSDGAAASAEGGEGMPPPPRRRQRPSTQTGPGAVVPPQASPTPSVSSSEGGGAPHPSDAAPRGKARKTKEASAGALSGQGGGNVRSVRRALPHLPYMQAPASLLWPVCLAAPQDTPLVVPLSILQGLLLQSSAAAPPSTLQNGSPWHRLLQRLLQLPCEPRAQLLCTASALVRIQAAQFSTGFRYSLAVKQGLHGWAPRLRDSLLAAQCSGPPSKGASKVRSALANKADHPMAGSVASVVSSIKASTPWAISAVLAARRGELAYQRSCARVMASASRAHALLRAARVGGAGTTAVLASTGVTTMNSSGMHSSGPELSTVLQQDGMHSARNEVYTPLHCSADFANGSGGSTAQGQLASVFSDLNPADEPLNRFVANAALHTLGPCLLPSPQGAVTCPAGPLQALPQRPDARGPHAGAVLPKCRPWRAADSLPPKPSDAGRAAGSSSTGGLGGGGTLQLQPAVLTASRTMPKFVQRDVTALLGGTDPADLRSTDVTYALYLAQCMLAHPAVDAMLRSAEDINRSLQMDAQDERVLERKLGKGHIAAQLAATAVVESGTGARAAVEAVQCGGHPVIVSTTLPNSNSAGDDKKCRLRTDPVAVHWSSLQSRADPAVLQALQDDAPAGQSGEALPSDLHSNVPHSWSVSTAASVEEALAVVQAQNAQLLGVLQGLPSSSLSLVAEGKHAAAAPGRAVSVMQATLGRAFGQSSVSAEAQGDDEPAPPALLESLPLTSAARPLVLSSARGSQSQAGAEDSPPRLHVSNVDAMLSATPGSPAAAAAAMSPPRSARRHVARVDGGEATRRTKKQAATLASLVRAAAAVQMDQRQPDTVGCLLLLQALRVAEAPAEWKPRMRTLWQRRTMWLVARCMTYLTKSAVGKNPWGTQSAALVAATMLRPTSVNHMRLVRPYRLPIVTPPPRRAAWVSLRRNFFQEDDTTLHYKPYFGDDDERELDLTGYSHSKVHTAINATQTDGAVLAADTVGAEFTSTELQGSALSGSPLADLPSVGLLSDDGTPVASPSSLAEGDASPLSLAAIMNADAFAAGGSTVAAQLAAAGAAGDSASALSQRLHRSGVMGGTAHRVMLLLLIEYLSGALGYAAPPPAPSHPMVSSKFKANQRATTRDGVTYSASDAEEEAGRAFKQVRHCLALLVHCAGDAVLRSLLFPGVEALSDTQRKGTAPCAFVRLDAAATNNVYCSSDFAVLHCTVRRMRASAPAAAKKASRRAKGHRGNARKQPRRGRGGTTASDESASVSGSPLPYGDDDAASVATSVSGSVRDDDESIDAASSHGGGTSALVWSSDVPLLLAALVERWREVHAIQARFRLCSTYGLLPQGHPLRCLPLLPILRNDALAAAAALLAGMAGDCVDSAQRQWLPLLSVARSAARDAGRWAADVGLGDMPPESEAALVPHLLEIRGVTSALSVPSAQPWSALHELGPNTLGVRANAATRADMQQALDLPADSADVPVLEHVGETSSGQAEGDGSHETLNVIFCPMTKVYDDRQHGVLHALPTPREAEEITRKRLMHGHYLRNSKLFLLALRQAAQEAQADQEAPGASPSKRPRTSSAGSSGRKSSRSDQSQDMPDHVLEALANESSKRAAAAARFGQVASDLASRAAALAKAANVPPTRTQRTAPVLTAREASLVPRLYRVAGGDVDAVCALLGYDAETMATGEDDPLGVLPKCKRNVREELLKKPAVRDTPYARLRASVLKAAEVALKGGHADAHMDEPVAMAHDDDGDTVLSGAAGGDEDEDVSLMPPIAPPATSSGGGRGRGKKDGGPPPEGGITESMLTRDAARLVAGEHKRVLVARSDIHGWGAFMGAEGAAARELVYEYRGELISQNEADRRGNIYDRLNMSYLFELSDLSVLDAARKGSKIRFANHSSNPNCAARVMSVLGGQRRIAFFARRNIAPGDELTFNYQYETDHSSAVRDNARSGGSARGRGRKRQRSSKADAKTPLLPTKGLSGAAVTSSRARRGGGGGSGGRRRRSGGS